MRLVTDTVMRPSPRPSARTETSPLRLASSREYSGIFAFESRSDFVVLTEALLASGLGGFLDSSAETWNVATNTANEAPMTAREERVKTRMLGNLSITWRLQITDHPV